MQFLFFLRLNATLNCTVAFTLRIYFEIKSEFVYAKRLKRNSKFDRIIWYGGVAQLVRALA